jgi:hypothetical protein
MVKRNARSLLVVSGLLLALLFGALAPAYAAACSSNLGPGVWTSPAMWTCVPGPNVVPAPGDDVTINGSDIVSISTNVTRNASTTNGGILTINTGGTLINYGTITNTGNLTSNPGGMLINYGTITNNNILTISGSGMLVNYGTIQVNGPVDNYGTLLNCGVIIGAVTNLFGGTVLTGPCPPPPGSTGAVAGPPCFGLLDGRINNDQSKDCAAPVAVYCTSDGFDVYAIDPDTSRGWLAVHLSQEAIDAAGTPATIIEDNGVIVSRLSDGEFQVNAWWADGKPYTIAWADCPAASVEHLQP